MAYSEALADRVRGALAERDDVIEKKMFGGLAFMIAGHMACGVINVDLMARVGPDRYDDALARPHVRPMTFTGKPLRGLVYVGPPAIRTAASLKKWVDQVATLAAATPKKKTKARAKPKPKKKTATRRG